MRPVDLHLPVQAVVEEEVVRHSYPVRLHGLAVVVVTDVIIIANSERKLRLNIGSRRQRPANGGLTAMLTRSPSTTLATSLARNLSLERRTLARSLLPSCCS